jgi:rhodanese-related sulfurtransferase
VSIDRIFTPELPRAACLLAECDEPPLLPDYEIALTCRWGNRSSDAACVLRDRGYHRLIIADSGIGDWIRARIPVLQPYSS